MAQDESRVLRADAKVIRTALDQLDETSSANGSDAEARNAERYQYRVRALTVEFYDSTGNWIKYVVPSRNISRTGVSVLAGNYFYTGTKCRVHLLSVHNHVQVIPGTVVRCRYLSGSGRLHEVGVQFQNPIDIALFHRGAMEMRILIVDDDPLMQQIIARLLNSLKTRIAAVSNAKAAMDLLAKETFDLVLLDIEMPEMDGLSAAREIRRNGYSRPLVALTASSDPDLESKCDDAGMNEILRKPIGRESLSELINKLRVDPIVSSMVHDRSMATLIDAFVEELQQRTREMESAFAREDHSALEAAVRWIKGAAGTHGFDMLTEPALELEKACCAKADSHTLREKMSALSRLCHAARPVNYVDKPSH